MELIPTGLTSLLMAISSEQDWNNWVSRSEMIQSKELSGSIAHSQHWDKYFLRELTERQAGIQIFQLESAILLPQSAWESAKMLQ